MNPLADGGSFFTSLGGILSGLAELLVAIGAGIGFLIRNRRTAQRERLRTEAAAALAAQETKKSLEAKLEAQHSIQIQIYKDQLEVERTAHANEKADLNNQIVVLQKQNENLVNRLIGNGSRDATKKDDNK